MWTTGVYLQLHAALMLGLTALLVLFRGDGDLELVTRGAMSLQLLCYWGIIIGCVLQRFGKVPADVLDD